MHRNALGYSCCRGLTKLRFHGSGVYSATVRACIYQIIIGLIIGSALNTCANMHARTSNTTYAFTCMHKDDGTWTTACDCVVLLLAQLKCTSIHITICSEAPLTITSNISSQTQHKASSPHVAHACAASLSDRHQTVTICRQCAKKSHLRLMNFRRARIIRFCSRALACCARGLPCGADAGVQRHNVRDADGLIAPLASAGGTRLGCTPQASGCTQQVDPAVVVSILATGAPHAVARSDVQDSHSRSAPS
jgi:hypothetical protein